MSGAVVACVPLQATEGAWCGLRGLRGSYGPSRRSVAILLGETDELP